MSQSLKSAIAVIYPRQAGIIEPMYELPSCSSMAQTPFDLMRCFEADQGDG
jgi:hypothetical protein